MRGGRRGPFEASFEAAVQAPTRQLQLRKGRAEHGTQGRVPPAPGGAAQREAPIDESRRGRHVGLIAAQSYDASAGEDAPPFVLERYEQVEDLDAQVLALHSVGKTVVEEELVSEVAALMIEAEPRRPRSVPVRQNRPHQVVGVQEVERRGREVELREDDAEQADLKAVA